MKENGASIHWVLRPAIVRCAAAAFARSAFGFFLVLAIVGVGGWFLLDALHQTPWAWVPAALVIAIKLCELGSNAVVLHGPLESHRELRHDGRLLGAGVWNLRCPDRDRRGRVVGDPRRNTEARCEGPHRKDRGRARSTRAGGVITLPARHDPRAKGSARPPTR